MDIQQIVSAQRDYFYTGATLDVSSRLAALDRLRDAILKYEDEINAALLSDLNKSAFETYMCETGLVLNELSYIRKRTAKWAKDKTVPTPLAQFPSRSFRHPEPYGVVLIMAPWNYPFMLALEPVVGAIAAGNCVVVKPSAYSPATSAVMAKLIASAFDPQYVTVVEGGRAENQALLDQKFDYIFFTGGTTVAREVMAKAAVHLTPVSLELGGKSPCIVDQTADIKVAARRLAFGKYLNSGQTCVAPDYLLVHESVKDRLASELEKNVRAFYGDDPLSCPDYVKMINDKHYQRVQGLIAGEHAVFGGTARDGKIAPTLLDGVTGDSPIMQEEIFGPVLPMLTYTDLDEAISFINARPKPLALYLFTTNKATEKKVLSRVSYGGGCVNDTIIHLATPYMPFGGVGSSGMGGYHGKASFDTFTHYKSVLKKANWLDLPMRYQPYTKLNEKLLRMFLK
jgi:aldehyde dehydrogenase (NAD+)